MHTHLYFWIGPERISLLCGDTDSIMFALPEKTIELSVKSELKQEFHHMLYGRCGERLPDHPTFPFTRVCCRKCIQTDQVYPLLYKEEYSATEMISLCAKTYCCIDDVAKTYKISSKGVSKQFIMSLPDPRQPYLDALQKKSPFYAENKGFRLLPNADGIVSYSQTRKGFGFDYVKRRVMPDGSTLSLNVTINPSGIIIGASTLTLLLKIICF